MLDRDSLIIGFGLGSLFVLLFWMWDTVTRSK